MQGFQCFLFLCLIPGKPVLSLGTYFNRSIPAMGLCLNATWTSSKMNETRR